MNPELRIVLDRVRLRASRRAAWLRSIWNDTGLPGGDAVITHAEVDAYLADRDAPEAEEAWLAANPDESLARLDSAACGESTRMGRLQRMFGLSAQECDVLQLCAAVALDPPLLRVCGYLADSVERCYVSEEIANRLFGHGRGTRLPPGAPLFAWHFVSVHDCGPAAPPALSIDPVVLAWLNGEHVLDPVLSRVSRLVETRAPLAAWPVASAAEFLSRSKGHTRVCVTGVPGVGRRTFAACVAASFELPLLAIDADGIADHEWVRAFVRAQRHGYLDGCAIGWFGESLSRRSWPQFLPWFPVQFAIAEAGQSPVSADGSATLTVALDVPATTERKRLWKMHVPASESWPDGALDTLASRFRATPGEIARSAVHSAATPDDVATMLREGARGKLGHLAQWIECAFTWDDLVIPDALRRSLEDFVFEAKDRVELWDSGAVQRLFPQGRGLLALFSGTPGTGKTMAAQVVAANLGLDLFRIDLASVVSKYVGETAQNLQKVLARAAHMHAVLLFDESDTLFAKRTEVKDAHDRYANTDTNYLLQAIESYPGVALLATNQKANIDTAFLRRIRYVLEFPKPDAAQREAILRRVVGELAGADVLEPMGSDLAHLARNLEITGSQIKSAVLTAVFAARRENARLNFAHLLYGIDRELQKDGRALSGRERGRLVTSVR